MPIFLSHPSYLHFIRLKASLEVCFLEYECVLRSSAVLRGQLASFQDDTVSLLNYTVQRITSTLLCWEVVSQRPFQDLGSANSLLTRAQKLIEEESNVRL